MKSFERIRFPFPLLFLLFVLSSGLLHAQTHTLSGKVTDEKNRQPLAFVNVVINEGLQGCITDIDGKYEISASEAITKISFSSIGYEPVTLVIEPNQRRCNIALKPTTFELGEVTVEAGENPAHRIIDSLLRHRKANNPNSLDSYRYNIYDQMVITIDSSNFGKALTYEMATDMTNLQMFDSILKKNNLMVMETASEVLFMAPDRKLQNVLGTKIAGMKEPTFIYLVNSMQSISFYEETINVTGTDYVNPISRGSKNHYFFTLESVSPIGQGDSLYVISFHPFKGSNFNGLRGSMTVNSDGWALQSVKAEPDKQEGLFTASIQQLYQKVEGQWFPKQLNTNLKFPSMVVDIDGIAFPMVAIGKSYLTDITINPEVSKKQFSDIEILVDPEAAFRDEDFWAGRRIDTLSDRIRATYAFVDSLTRGNDLIDKALVWTEKLVNQSAVPLGPIDLNLGNMINISGQRGLFFGLGASTNDRFSRFISFSSYFGYWTRLKRLDFGAGANMYLNRQRQMELGVYYGRRSHPIGEFGGLQERYSLLSESDYKYSIYENIHARGTRLDLSFATRFARHFKVFVNLNTSHRNYNAQFFHLPSDSLTEARFTQAEVKLRFAYKEKFLSTINGLQSLGTTYPVVWLSYMHAFPYLGSHYEYDRFKFEVSKNFYTPYMGVSKIILQAGYATEGCPVMETFNILGSYDRFGLYSPGSFGTMRLDEFFCDRFVALYLSHNFSGMLWKTDSEWFKPELVLITNLGWGDMPRTRAYPDKNFKTMEKGYYESGFVVKGLLNLPLVKVGLGAFYRYGPYSFDNVWNNFAFKWSATFTM